MDGHFVPNLSYGPDVLKALRPHTSLPFDVHLMVTSPEMWIAPFIQAGADLLTFHVEIALTSGAEATRDWLTRITYAGVKAGLALNPDTPLQALEPFLPFLDLVLVMTVQPGFGGQTLRDDQVSKIAALRARTEGTGLRIHVDGGIKADNADRLHEAGAHALIAGSAILSAPDYAAAIQALRFPRAQI